MCYSLWYNAHTMLPVAGSLEAEALHYTAGCNTQSSAPEDGQNKFPKYVELIGIINKPLLLHIVGCLYYLNQKYVLHGYVSRTSHICPSLSTHEWVPLLCVLIGFA